MTYAPTRAEQIHAANRERILAERRAMESRYRNTRRFSSRPLFKVMNAVGEAELEKPEGVERHCMRCEATFMSTGPGHRMCCGCRRLTEAIE